MPRYLLKFALCLLLAGFSGGVFAQTRAWLDRDSVRAGETVTLNVESDGNVGGGPDYSPLYEDFEPLDSKSNTRIEPGVGGMVARSRYVLTLRPKRSGRLTVAALRVGGVYTKPLNLYVEPEPADTQPAIASSAQVFVEVVPDDENPYVQQAVGWLVRLYSSVPIVGGKLDQPVPDGASLMKIGDDAQYERNIGGNTYTVVERRYLLVPERSGRMSVPPAAFDGRSAPSLIDQLVGGGGDPQHARSKSRVLNVRPVPANAPQPWLPLRSLDLRYRTTPQQLRMGNAASVVVEATVDGASLAQLPELQLPPIDGVQVFAEPVQADEGFTGGRPRVKLTRKFSLVPAREGPVHLDGLRLDWWDVAAGSARSASLPALSWTVTPASGAATGATGTARATGQAADAAGGDSNATSGAVAASGATTSGGTGWAVAAVLFALLWLATLLWALHLRAQPRAFAAAKPAAQQAAGTEAAALTLNLPALRQLIDVGDFDHIASVLRGLARPPARDDDELIERLADPGQREAVQALRRARWGGGDGVAARTALRAAFAKAPQWRQTQGEAASPLAPLYPVRK
ncbi:BatD family protein [Lysobacter sp. TAB13]|uniref:BatD family protein n=1 Tax=Lysobacter sp. TAB13 TaxID=3233065 RepID=UPI003F99926A